ncbi:hypothetical protein [Amycolatopsis sp. 195334CR]|uniref:hypothetical protein n=1 Tax=Amycolatopsis sp. 195334CR TaxID=2814588 RepID=UPI001A8FA964|nr:hypothetical protein [Amycolatopsis sp. 195334CR]MBN6035437.1 hypothetical protein [Amycolatopsis sp. 195334CR]
MSADDDELAGELRRLFDDERLGLRPAPDAGQLIVAGAKRRRVRRRRMSVAGGALGVVALVAGGFALTGGGFRHETPPPVAQPPGPNPSLQIGPSATMIPVPAPTSPPPGSAPPPQPPPNPHPGHASMPPPTATASDAPAATPKAGPPVPVIGPGGYGKLRLNTTMEQASSAGINFTPENSGGVDGGCTSYFFSGTGVPSGGSVVVSPNRGVVYINPSVPATTPEGVGAGTTRDQLQKTYPEATTGPNGDVVPIGNGYRYRLVVGETAVVEHVYLDDSYQDCYE